MLEAMIELARGPLLKLSLLVMFAGLLRAFALQAWEIGWAFRRAGDHFVPWKLVIARNLSWLLPWRYLKSEERFVYNFVSFLFHVAIVLVPIFLAGHVAIWEKELGIGWWTLPPRVADVLTVVGILALVGLLVGRYANRGSRAMSRLGDWLLPVLCLAPFVTGFMTSHPAWSPWNARISYLLHLLTAELLLVVVPFSKLVHVVLFWSSQASSELGWRFPPGFGHRVRQTLGKEGQGV